MMKLMIKIEDSLIFFQFLPSNFFSRFFEDAQCFCVNLSIFAFRKFFDEMKNYEFANCWISMEMLQLKWKIDFLCY